MHLNTQFICTAKSSTVVFKKIGLTCIAENCNHRRDEMMMVTTMNFNVALPGRCSGGTFTHASPIIANWRGRRCERENYDDGFDGIHVESWL